jgi:hypothetical protein
VSTPYQKIKEFLEERNRGVRRGERLTLEGARGVLAMARKNDPFYAGQGWQMEQAEWFVASFRRLGFEGRRVHLRFHHYVASGQEPHPETGEYVQERLPDDRPYENTDESWAFIQEASKHARNMGLVSPASIIDRRTPRPFLNVPEEPATEPWVELSEPRLMLPSIEVADLDPYCWEGSARPLGYGYSVAHEPSLVEMWIEKSLDEADNPLIESLCDELGVNLVTGIGFMTISSVHSLLRRRAQLGKPMRILYVSDFDPAGKHMPISPARHVEFALRELRPEEKPDIRLRHLALTAEQVRELALPRQPIKESDLRKGNFERTHGEGAVELNALMHETRVSWTERMLRGAILELRDGELPEKLREAGQDAQRMLGEEMNWRVGEHHRVLAAIEEEAKETADRYREELEDLAARLEAEIAPLRERAEGVRLAARRRLEGLEGIELPEADLGEEPEGAAEGWLYDARRDYDEQLRYYKRHKDGGVG